MQRNNDLEEVKESKGRKFLFFVEKSSDERDYKKYEQMRMEIWKDINDHLSCPRNMAAENYYNDGSNLFLGIYAQDEMGRIRRDDQHFAGFAYGYVGVLNKNVGYQRVSNLNFYSQYAAVSQEYRNLNLGIMLKQFQKKIVKDIFHIDTITCTFDPLTGVNAYRNIHKLGMEVMEYKESFYKGFSGALNRIDIPGDRFYVLWRLKEKNKKKDYDLDSLLKQDNLVLGCGQKKIKINNRRQDLEVSREVDIDKQKFKKNYLLIEIPYDFYGMIRKTDVSDEKARRIPLDWRMKTRRAFQTFFNAGYKLEDFRSQIINHRHRNFYVLTKNNPS
jgi:predicted GNAT superfamily acetyltransferase